MKVGWLIDAGMFDAYRDDLVASIRSQGHEVQLIRAPAPPYRWDDAGSSYRDAFPKDACVVALGDIELITRVRDEGRWAPGAFATIEHYACSSYFCRFGEFLLSRNYVMLPFGELRRCQEFLFDAVGRDGRIFVRPDSPLKIFTGQVVAAESYEAELEFMGFYEFPPESIVVVSAPRAIETEWRFVVVRGRIVAGSQYKHDGKNDSRPEYPEEAMRLAARIASLGYEPDPAWIMEVCQTTDGELHLLEIGGFSFADLYSCNKGDLVAAVSEAAWNVWEQEYA